MTLDAPAAPAPPLLLDLVRAGEWRRAAATANAQGADVDVIDALQTIHAVQDDIRARRYVAARNRLQAYREVAASLPGDVGAELRLYVQPDALIEALHALEGSQRESDPDALANRLAGALAQPLTRAEALNAQGVLQAMLGHEAQAREVFSAAREADPGHYRALTNLGNLDMEAGHFAQAEQTYREVIQMAPEYDGGHHNLGVSVRRQGRVAEGVRSIRQAQRLAMKRSREDTQAEVKEQFARRPVLKYARVVVIAALLLIVFLALRGPGT
ncbi:tetratricopeptide repeat protein [Deinococcus radiotolerans]|uniref:Tetratricopeptide repeat protein n=1 Tax=Deinococcus radiotolerans TaxID=1309407 RepID=A0ABQ2FE28_9DEIO|nr:tetratricopeptide repeat protein [Deinococcus radiotolerans]GGK89370.1 hypothetical protein GCM10010844_04840 [Deinococcus radiotolerans]